MFDDLGFFAILTGVILATMGAVAIYDVLVGWFK